MVRYIGIDNFDVEDAASGAADVVLEGYIPNLRMQDLCVVRLLDDAARDNETMLVLAKFRRAQTGRVQAGVFRTLLYNRGGNLADVLYTLTLDPTTPDHTVTLGELLYSSTDFQFNGQGSPDVPAEHIYNGEFPAGLDIDTDFPNHDGAYEFVFPGGQPEKWFVIAKYRALMVHGNPTLNISYR